ncbi:MAG TPA: hypothetical protein PKE29_01515 [Phycisphaerales bacterium]|nr:hypothetical protein [Phycisphaerales bacterium]
MALAHRVGRLEREMTTDARTGAVARRCRVCRDGANRREVVHFDGAPAWGQRADPCPGCGRDVVDVVHVRGIDPGAL